MIALDTLLLCNGMAGECRSARWRAKYFNSFKILIKSLGTGTGVASECRRPRLLQELGIALDMILLSTSVALTAVTLAGNSE